MLTHRQEVFVMEYAIDRIGTRAARAAGYSVTSAHVASSRLLRNDKVRAAIAAQQASLALKLDLSLERVLMSLAEACEQAREQGRPDLMIAASREIARLCGFYSEPTKDTSQPKELSGMTDEQLYALLAETQ